MRNPTGELSGDQQSGALRLFFPAFRQVARGNPWVWEGPLTPIGASTYRVRVVYYPHLQRPRVFVTDPPIVARKADEPIPHTLGSAGICLHLNEEWRPSMYIHQTIVPWTSLWLYYYEVWHATGEWLGGGHEPADDEVARAREDARHPTTKRRRPWRHNRGEK